MSPRNRSEQQRIQYRQRRQEVIAHYGGKCECCGEHRFEFLALDHREGGGNAHRALIGGGGKPTLRWIRDNNYPDMFRILCHNCNQARGSYGKCPHEDEMG